MTDSFFTARNDADPEFERCNPPALYTNMILEACVRQLCRREGAYQAAVRIQRIADICAGVQVHPLEHWQKTSRPAAPAPKPKGRVRRFLAAVADNAAVAFWAGVLVGLWMGGR